MSDDPKYFTGYRDVTEEAIREDAERDGAFGFSLPSLKGGSFELSFVKAVQQLQQSAVLTVTAAIMEWCSKVGMTPEQWLELYEPEVTLKPWQPGENSLTLKLVVTAKLREGEHTFTVKV
jgi:hypothetical protein